MNHPRLRLGEILLESGLLSQEKLNLALEIQKEHQLRLGTILLQEGFLSEPHLLQALSRHLSIPWVSIWRIDIPDEALNLVPSNVAEEFFLIPIYIRSEKDGDRALYVAMNDPSDAEAMRFVAATAGMDVKPMIAGPADIASAIRFYYYDEELETVPPFNPLADAPETDSGVEDLTDEVELVPSVSLSPDLYASNPPTSAETSSPRTSILPPADDRWEQPETAAKDVSVPTPERSSQPPQKRQPRASSIPAVAIPERLSSAPSINEAGAEVFQNKEAARREAERRIYGVGRKKTAESFALTLLDGTTLSFSGNRESGPPSDLLGQDGFLLALKSVTNGTEPPPLPPERWQAYAAAALQILFRKGLFIYDEFMDEVAKIENKRQ